MKIVIKRKVSNRQCVLGQLYFYNDSGFVVYLCYTLELPNLKNTPRISCIPAGVYKGKKHKSPSNGPCIQLSDVPNRSYIQIHAGNTVFDTLGCILVGFDYVKFNPEHAYQLVNSRPALNTILKHLTNEPFTIEIYDEF